MKCCVNAAVWLMPPSRNTPRAMSTTRTEKVNEKESYSEKH